MYITKEENYGADADGNRGKQIRELNLFELKQHMKEVNDEIGFKPIY